MATSRLLSAQFLVAIYQVLRITFVQRIFVAHNSLKWGPHKAFRFLSHKFHGKGSGKMKTEKRANKQADAMKYKMMSAIDTPLNTSKMMKNRQEKSQTPYVVLSGGGKNLLTTYSGNYYGYSCVSFPEVQIQGKHDLQEVSLLVHLPKTKWIGKMYQDVVHLVVYHLMHKKDDVTCKCKFKNTVTKTKACGSPIRKSCIQVPREV